MFGPETFIVRIAEDAMAPRVRTGDYVCVDPDEPAVDGRLVAVHDPGRGGETVVRNYASYCTSMVRFVAYSWVRCRFRR